MRSQGFLTIAAVPNSFAGSLVGLHQGFDYSLDGRILGGCVKSILGTKLYNLIEDNLDRNFFLYIHSIDPHSPYDPPAPFDLWYKQLPKKACTRVKRNDALDPNWVKEPSLEGRISLYDGEIAYNDFYLPNLINKLEEIKDKYKIIKIENKDYSFSKVNDDSILDDVKYAIKNKLEYFGNTDPIVVTNDKLFRLRLEYEGIQTQEFKMSVPFKSASELYTGFIKEGEKIAANIRG